MEKKWLVNQLSPEKRKSALWSGFAEALSTIYSQQIKPIVERLSGMSSFFTMDDADLQRKIDEMGTFFYFTNNIEREDLPLAVMQKLDEVHFKRTDLPVENTIAREFGGLAVKWAAYYAPLTITPANSKDYTKKEVNGKKVSALRTKYELDAVGENIKNYFMTSRGVIQVTMPDLLQSGITQDEFSALIKRLVRPIIPTEIVFDGEQLIIHYDIIEPLERIFTTNVYTYTLFNMIYDFVDKPTADAFINDRYIADNSMQVPDGHLVRYDAIPLDSWLVDQK